MVSSYDSHIMDLRLRTHVPFCGFATGQSARHAPPSNAAATREISPWGAQVKVT
jgi:hypothetical protein